MGEIRIATRGSQLAIWQANAVKAELEKTGKHCKIIEIESSGDIELTKPIYELGITGVFTKQLDIALLENQADIAVHSLKDVPTKLAQHLIFAAALQRGPSEDVIIMKSKEQLNDTSSKAKVASSSLRRKAQWLSKYPNHEVVPIRGNVNTRLRKFDEDETLNGIIFAKAGLERLALLPEYAVTLSWMLSAPAQGIVGIVCRENDEEMIEACKGINHSPSFIEGNIERQFMGTLMGGCSVPISALACLKENVVEFTGAIHSFDGKRSFWLKRKFNLPEAETAGKTAAMEILQQQGAKELIEEIRKRDLE